MRNRLVGVALGLCAAAAVLWLSASHLVRPRLLSESSGEIRAVLIHWVPDAGETVGPSIRAFLAAVSPRVEVFVACRNRAEYDRFLNTADGWGLGRSQFKPILVGSPITAWSKDRFLVARGGTTELWPPRSEPSALESRTNDALVAPALASAYPSRFTVRPVQLSFDAGDVLDAGRCVLASDTLHRKNGRPSGFQRLLGDAFGKPAVWLRDVPDHHIGMYAAVLDSARAVVGDPSLAKPMWSSVLGGKFGAADFGPKVQSLFDNAARQLQEAGFRVARVPTVYFEPQVYLTYTNGVFETRGDERRAYLPVYGISELDRAARNVYDALGWRVLPIPVDRVYRMRGTIGCLVNVLERG